MRNALTLLAAVLLMGLMNCALTYDEGGAGQAAQTDYFDPGSPDNNAGYFNRVIRHFEECGIRLSEHEARRYTATRFISSVPPVAAVYVGARYIGRTNGGALYFEPGQYLVTFVKNGRQWSEILVFVAGRNASLVVRGE